MHLKKITLVFVVGLMCLIEASPISLAAADGPDLDSLINGKRLVQTLDYNPVTEFPENQVPSNYRIYPAGQPIPIDDFGGGPILVVDPKTRRVITIARPKK